MNSYIFNQKIKTCFSGKNLSIMLAAIFVGVFSFSLLALSGTAVACHCPPDCPPPEQTYTISGMKFNDKNGNGVKDCCQEPGLSGWTITIEGPESFNDSVTTNYQGKYEFSGLKAGSYTVCEVQQDGWTQTYPTDNNGCHLVEISNSNVCSINFGNQETQIPEPVCGNGVIEGDETCDDGNIEDGDGCSSVCLIEEEPGPICGNGVIEGDETCDDGNIEDGDGCSAVCLIEEEPGPICGNGALEGDEECDDGNTEDGDGCSAFCVIEFSSSTLIVIDHVVGGTATSGDFTVYVTGINPLPSSFPGEESPGTSVALDPGVYSVSQSDNPDYTTSFSADCSSTIMLGETKTCTITNTRKPYCGDGKCDSGESCSTCSQDCGSCGGGCFGCGVVTPYCGDGILNGDEECDKNAGVIEGYICNSSCVLEEITSVCMMDLDVMMVIDVSGSMGYNSPTRLSLAKDAANSFLDNLRSGDKSGLVSFSWTASLNKELSNNHVSTQSIIDGLTASGATNIGEAINKANQELISVGVSPSVSKVEILLTDGRANKPNGDGLNENPDDIALALNKSLEAAENGIVIFTIGLGSDVNSNMLSSIANNTGGKYYFAPKGEDLDGIFNQIASETCRDSSATSSAFIEPPISIFNARVSDVSGTKATVSWYTNVPATSRVIYDTVLHSVLGEVPNYGYAFSTAEQDSADKVIFHEVTITGLTQGIDYYWRPVSHGSPEVLGDELNFNTGGAEDIETPIIEETTEEIPEEVPEETPEEIPEESSEETEAGEEEIPSESALAQATNKFFGFLASIGDIISQFLRGDFSCLPYWLILILVAYSLLKGFATWKKGKKEAKTWFLWSLILIALTLCFYIEVCLCLTPILLLVLAIGTYLIRWSLSKKKEEDMEDTEDKENYFYGEE
jgi:cysteine-rich repeat protein